MKAKLIKESIEGLGYSLKNTILALLENNHISIDDIDISGSDHNIEIEGTDIDYGPEESELVFDIYASDSPTTIEIRWRVEYEHEDFAWGTEEFNSVIEFESYLKTLRNAISDEYDKNNNKK